LKKDWQVLRSIESQDGYYCVDFFVRPDGSYGFEEFRRDHEDNGKWTRLNRYSSLLYETREAAEAEARNSVPWLQNS